MPGRRDFSSKTLLAFAAMALAFGGCDRSSATTGPSNVDPSTFATNLRTQGGDQQVGAVGAALVVPLAVKVVDAGGQPIAGATVTWQTRAGGGSVNPPASSSNASGMVTTTWTMGTTLGANRVVALLTGQFFLDSASFTATAINGPPRTVEIIAGNQQSSNAGRTLGTPLTIKVKDSYGFNVPGAKVVWTTGNLSGTVTFNVADTTVADGTASATWKLGTLAAPQSAFATVTGVAPAAFNATVAPDTGRVLTLTAGNLQTAASSTALPTQLRVTLADEYGNPIVGDPIVWTDSIAGGGTINPLLNLTDAAGQATATWTLGARAGAQLLRAKSATNIKATYTANATVALVDVNAGNYSTCAIGADGFSYCWGYGADGQLGKLTNFKNVIAPTTSVSTADTLAGPFLTFRQLNGGKNHACGVTIGRDVYCWGSNNVGQIGPVPAGGTPGKWLATQAFSRVEAGEFNTCAVTPTGALYCSGLNDQGQIGGAAGGSVLAATLVPAPGAYALPPGTPPTVYSSVAVGQAHVCAMPRFNADPTQTPVCWGYNTTGQTGQGVAPPPSNTIGPTPINIAGLPIGVLFDSTSLVLGALHSCVITRFPVAGTTYCWGSNGFGQLGTGGSPTSTTFTTAPAVAVNGQTFVALAAGAYHTCGLTSGGAAYCWGSNSSGQLGDGTRTDASAPVAVAGGLTFRSITAGELYTCGVVGSGTVGGTSTAPGTAYCWGDNEYGQLGINTVSGNNAPILTPRRVSFQP